MRKLNLLSLALGLALLCVLPASSQPAPRAAASGIGAPADSDVVQAVVHRDVASLRDLLRRGDNPSAVDASGTPAVVVAVYLGEADAVEALVEGRPEVARQPFKDKNGDPSSPLMVALLLQKTDIAKVLIKAGADVNAVASKGPGVAGIAVINNDLDELRLLVDAGADVKKQLPGQLTLLHVAAARERPEIIAALIGYGVDPNLRDDYGTSPLRIAAEAGNLESAKALLEHGAWPYTMDASGDTPLSVARRRITDPVKSAAMVQLLLQHGAPADGNGRPIDSAYLDAVIRGDLPAVKAALAKGADIDARRRGTLNNAVSEGVTLAVEHPDVLAYLIEHGIDVQSRSTVGFTALHFASGHEGNLQSIQLLVDHGVDVNVKSKYGETPLGRAVNGNKPDAVALLLKLGADPHARGVGGMNLLDLARNPNHSALLVPMLEKAGTTADPPGTPAASCSLNAKPAPPCVLAFYARNGNAAGIERALSDHVDINARDPGGLSLLSLALELPKSKLAMALPQLQTDSVYGRLVDNKLKTARLLLDHGIDVTLADANGTTALHIAAYDPRLVGFIDILIDKGAKANAVLNTHQMAPLHLAVQARNKEGIEHLLDKGADPDLPMDRGITPLLMAVEDKQTDIASVLLKHGAKANVTAASGMSPLKAAVQDGNRDMIALLLAAGADPDFDGGTPPSPRTMSRGMDSALQALFAAPAVQK